MKLLSKVKLKAKRWISPGFSLRWKETVGTGGICTGKGVPAIALHESASCKRFEPAVGVPPGSKFILTGGSKNPKLSSEPEGHRQQNSQLARAGLQPNNFLTSPRPPAEGASLGRDASR